MLFHVHVFVETRLRWNDDAENMYDDVCDGEGRRKYMKKEKRQEEVETCILAGQSRELRRCERSKYKYREDERLLPLFVPRNGYEYFPPHMIVYQRS